MPLLLLATSLAAWLGSFGFRRILAIRCASCMDLTGLFGARGTAIGVYGLCRGYSIKGVLSTLSPLTGPRVLANKIRNPTGCSLNPKPEAE